MTASSIAQGVHQSEAFVVEPPPVPPNPTLAAALAYIGGGLSILPIKRDGSKQPVWDMLPSEWNEAEARYRATWNPFKDHTKPDGEVIHGQLPTEDEVRTWFDRERPPGIGVIGGRVSGNLETLDFDTRAEEIFPQWRELVESQAPGLIARLSIARTPKPGYHVRYRCEAEIPSNAKLAEDPSLPGKQRTLIETRGEGGYALAPGTPAECHETKRLYEHYSGPKLSQVQTITQTEWAVLHRCARIFDLCTPEPDPARPEEFSEDSPGSEFNRRGPDWSEILTGWTEVGRGGERRLWKRPGKSERGMSATTGHCKGKDGTDRFYVFSSNATPFEPEKSYSKFAAFALLHHNGDFSAAARELAQKGYGKPASKSAGPTGTKPKGKKGVAAEPVEANGLTTTCLAKIRPQPIHWLVPGYFPRGKTILYAGDGGHGKSSSTLDITACLTTGRPCFGLDYTAPPPCDVLLISCEDDFADTVVPRLLAAGANLNRVHRLDGIRTKDGRLAPFDLRYYEPMRQHLASNPEIKLIIIDPAGAYIGRAGVNENHDAELRSLLDPLAETAAATGVTILLIKHLTKGATAKAVHKVAGSAGYVNAVRAAFILAPDRDDNDLKLLMPIKFNCGSWPRSLAMRLEDLADCERASILEKHAKHLSAEDQQALAKQLYRVAWQGAVDRDADVVVGDEGHRGHGRNKVETCMGWLREFLREYAYPSEEIIKAGEKVGFTFDNIKEAKVKLKREGLHNSTRGVFQGPWWSGFGELATWRLRPDPSVPTPHTPESPDSPPSPHSPHYREREEMEGRAGSQGSVGSPGRDVQSGERHQEAPHIERRIMVQVPDGLRFVDDPSQIPAGAICWAWEGSSDWTSLRN